MSLCVFRYVWYVVLFFILFWLDAQCACAIVERQFYEMSMSRLYVWLRVEALFLLSHTASTLLEHVLDYVYLLQLVMAWLSFIEY